MECKMQRINKLCQDATGANFRQGDLVSELFALLCQDAVKRG